MTELAGEVRLCQAAWGGCEGLRGQLSEGVRRRQPANVKGFPSPWSLKYLGSRTSEKVKNKILELLYSWTVGLPEEVKIAEAYQMLKKQGEAHSSPPGRPLLWSSGSKVMGVPFNCPRTQPVKPFCCPA